MTSFKKSWVCREPLGTDIAPARGYTIAQWEALEATHLVSRASTLSRTPVILVVLSEGAGATANFGRRGRERLRSWGH